MKEDVKKEGLQKQTRTVLVSRLDPDSFVGEVREFFANIGPVKKCFLVRDQEHGFTGVAYITYEIPSDASKAVETLHGKLFNGKQIGVKFSKDKGKESGGKPAPLVIKKEVQHVYFKRMSSSQRNKKGRIIVRNMHFNVTEDNLRSFFAPYGPIKEISILKKPDGKSKGVAFVQFDDFQKAEKAIEECHTKVLFGRKLSLDLAIPKRDYDGQSLPADNASDPIQDQPMQPLPINNALDPMQMLRDSLKKQAAIKPEEVEIKTEEDCGVKEEEIDAEECAVREEKIDTVECGVSEEEVDAKECVFKEEDSMDLEDSGIEGENKLSPEPKMKKFKESASKDVAEGRTLFIKNICLDSDELAVKNKFSTYGQVKKLHFCIDRQTERFKGTAFIEFQTQGAADACLEAFSDPACKKDFMLQERSLYVMRAISREDLKFKQDQKAADKEKKDTRNIYLAREGVIREGTLAAKGVSKKDLAIRTQREVLKRKLLANFNSFVSPTRLFVQNLPLTLTDNQLKDIFRIHSPEDAVITEVRIMRNLHDLDSDNVAKSKGFGFVSFSKHADALHAVRTVNNNPTIFNKNQRPVVEFSIENRMALIARENRLFKSKENNNRVNKAPKSGIQTLSRGESHAVSASGMPDFVGSKYDPKRKGIKSLSSHIGPKIRRRDFS